MVVLNGDDLRRAFAASTHSLEVYRDAINALNVFPVPDGDTGTNMLLTMRSALEKCPEHPNASAGEVLAGLADGAFWGARGNSGVILSQLFKGFAEAIQDEACDGPGLVQALSLATDAAYQSVTQPVEGTMLSVIRAASSGIQDWSQDSEGTDAISLWERAFQAASEALALTPSQLPILREAGVVDAGGMGVVVVLGGALCSLAGTDAGLLERSVASFCVEPGTFATADSSNHADYLDSTLDSSWGYCIQYVIEGTGLEVDAVRTGLSSEQAASAVVVGNSQHVRVHVHATDPGPAISYGASLGRLDQIRIEDMSRQNLEFVAEHKAMHPGAALVQKNSPAAQLAVIAVVQGDGLAALFRDTGCSEIINGGQTMNPSVGELLAAADATNAADIILLPNNSNVLASARQCVGANPRLHVVPSKTVPQGVAALLAFNPAEPLDRNLEAMAGVLHDVVSIEVTKAVRSATIGALWVVEGQYMGLIEGEPATLGESPEKALYNALSQTINSPDQVITMYLGAGVPNEAPEEVVRQLEEDTPGIQIDLVHGGQPHYQYLASVE